jgi:hypothetical protein
MTGAADGAPPPAAHASAARRRSAGIYGTIVASAVLAAGGGQLATVPLAVTVLVTLLVYWAAEGYAELLGEAHAGHLPTWGQVRASLATIWPMVSASYVPLLSLSVARVLGADTKTAATVTLVVAVVLLLVQGWAGGRASQLRGLRLLAVTLIAGAFGVVMILLKLLITH